MEMNDRLPEIVSKCDLSLILSAYEGICISALESLAVGVPVAAMPVGDISEYIHDMENGILLDKNSSMGVNVAKMISFLRTYKYNDKYRGYLEPYLPANCFSHIAL